MIDLSDGLATDLGKLCRASGVGAEIHADAIPIHPGAADGREGFTDLKAALGDGEDYELLFTLPTSQAEKVGNDTNLPLPITRIGKITADPALILIHPDGSREPLPEAGWEHGT